MLANWPLVIHEVWDILDFWAKGPSKFFILNTQTSTHKTKTPEFEFELILLVCHHIVGCCQVCEGWLSLEACLESPGRRCSENPTVSLIWTGLEHLSICMHEQPRQDYPAHSSQVQLARKDGGITPGGLFKNRAMAPPPKPSWHHSCTIGSTVTLPNELKRKSIKFYFVPSSGEGGGIRTNLRPLDRASTSWVIELRGAAVASRAEKNTYEWKMHWISNILMDTFGF